MSLVDEASDGGGSATDSFWEIGQYRRAVKRCDDGFEMCSKLSLLMQERAEIEKQYAGSLKRFAQKWRTFLDKGPEYGTTKSAWGGVAEEADALSEIHNDIRNKLVENVQADVKNWQKEHYHKTTLPPQRLKESKDFEDKFQRAQKQWARQYKQVSDCKKAYHSACKQDRSLKLQLQNAKNDPSAQAEQVRKLEDKVKKVEREVERTETAYKNALADLENFNPSYMRNMSEVFAECQAFEQLRLSYFKEALSRYQRAVDISCDERLPPIYSNLHSTIQRAEAHQDLRWWSQHNGEDMPMQWPKFEEYVPEMKQTISKAMKSGSSLATDEGVRLHAISSSHGGSVRGAAVTQQQQEAAGASDSPRPSADRSNSAATAASATAAAIAMATANNNNNDHYDKSLNPFADEFSQSQHEDLSYMVAEGLSKSTSFQVERSNPFESEEQQQQQQQQQAGNLRQPSGVASAANASSAAAHNTELDAEDPLFDDGRPGVKVKALYDYECTDDDELSFKKDDIFEKLDEEDEQGWCKGRKDGRVGLYPANYAVPV
uniref:SH3 domain-containing protein n=1 Tax=Macrostomum lignano TaxID=282301 RepID=A0A1I8G1F0_9PLAT